MANKQSSRLLTWNSVLEETTQGHSTRIYLYEKLEKLLDGKYVVVSFFTMFGHPRVLLHDADADMLEEVLQNLDIGNRQLALILNCPGGSTPGSKQSSSSSRTKQRRAIETRSQW
jgi:hypothetical protein